MLYDDAFLRRLARGLGPLLPRWGLESGAIPRLHAVSENATFFAGTGDRRVVLRVYRPGYHDAAEILSELAWIEALRAAGTVPTPRPLRADDGARLLSFHDGAALRHVAAFEPMRGRAPDAEADLPRWFRHLGGITARLHAQARSWTPPDGFRRKRWSFETILGRAAYWGDWRRAPGLDAAGRRVLERLHARLEVEAAALGDGPDRFGLVHCDLRAANLLVEGTRMAVIDFDDCGLCWFGYDFAAAVSFIEDAPVLPALRAAWLEGYRAHAPFPQVQERALPMLVMLRRMQLTAWIASHAETPTARALGPAYARGTVALAAAYLGPA